MIKLFRFVYEFIVWIIFKFFCLILYGGKTKRICDNHAEIRRQNGRLKK